MLSEKYVHSYLATRDKRQDILNKLLAESYPALLFFALNIPGAMKVQPGSFGLYKWCFDRLHAVYPEIRVLIQGSDLLGPYTFFRLDTEPIDVKQQCVALETAEPFARLLDLDVYDSKGQQVDRNMLGFPARSCLVCQQPAVECIRLQRHKYDEVITRTNELLAPFRY
jgi:holo-ACP synthase